ncbi:DUF2837 family protein [Bacillus lacus]|uniref:Lipid II flippase Amj n=1 Tax=Metabacillus lacus TaxID=1983721 RepID=A0A7X2J1M7_9BACI|nr:lipid II flippase Amj family protein [Metabacillus lacus]MRX73801.1 DUF2837 family protein [Metabacillus lacus]
MSVFTVKVLFVSVFLMVIHSIETLAYAVRLSGARVKLIATALSLFSMMVIFSRMANMMQQPVTGSLLDTANSANPLLLVEKQFRILIMASTAGTILGILLLPTFTALFSRGIIHLSKERGSIKKVLAKAMSKAYFKRGLSHISLPKLSYIRDLDFKNVPKKLFLINMAVTAVFTIGVLSALYASLLAPEQGASAIMASGLINGAATILLSFLVDPKISILADDVVNGKGSYASLKGISVMMVGSRLLGTLLAQLLFIPGAYYIAWATKYLLYFQ